MNPGRKPRANNREEETRELRAECFKELLVVEWVQCQHAEAENRQPTIPEQ